jgi:hypothetical protein
MSRQAVVYKVLIASPSDVQEERNLIPHILRDWTTAHLSQSGVVLEPVLWETHAVPEMGDRPQGILNRQLVDTSDLLIGVFWTRIGTATGLAESGSVEEIEEFISSGKPVMLYFSRRAITPDAYDGQQYERLQAFKARCRTRGLLFEYDTWEQLKDLLYRHITAKVQSLLSPEASAIETRRDANVGLVLDLQLADLKAKKPLGTATTIVSRYLQAFDEAKIPDYSSGSYVRMDENPNYYRELMRYVIDTASLCPVGFRLFNADDRVLNDVTLRFLVPKEKGLLLKDPEHYPTRPSKSSLDVSGGLRGLLRKHAVVVEDSDDVWHVSVSLGKVQPKAIAWSSEPLYIGAMPGRQVLLQATVYADELSTPVTVPLALHVKVEQLDLDEAAWNRALSDDEE